MTTDNGKKSMLNPIFAKTTQKLKAITEVFRILRTIQKKQTITRTIQ